MCTNLTHILKKTIVNKSASKAIKNSVVLK